MRSPRIILALLMATLGLVSFACSSDVDKKDNDRPETSNDRMSERKPHPYSGSYVRLRSWDTSVELGPGADESCGSEQHAERIELQAGDKLDVSVTSGREVEISLLTSGAGIQSLGHPNKYHDIIHVVDQDGRYTLVTTAAWNKGFGSCNAALANVDSTYVIYRPYEGSSDLKETQPGSQPTWNNSPPESKDLLVTLKTSRAELSEGEDALITATASNRFGKLLDVKLILQLGNGLLISGNCLVDPCMEEFQIADGHQGLVNAIVRPSGPAAKSYSVVLHYDYSDPEDPNGRKGSGKVEGWLNAQGSFNEPPSSASSGAQEKPTDDSSQPINPKTTLLSNMAIPASDATLNPENIPEEGLVGYWSFDTDRTETVLDSSGFDNHGSKVGLMDLVEGRYGNALRFNGVTNYVTIPDSPELRLNSTQTISAWYQWDGRGSKWRRLVGKGDYWKRNYGLWIRAESNMILFQIYGPGPRPTSPKGCEALNRNVIFDDGWHHLAGSYEDGTYRLYFDGELIQLPNQCHAVTEPFNTNHPVTIGFATGESGDWGDNDNSLFDGLIDEVRIYNRVLSDCEIASLAGSPC